MAQAWLITGPAGVGKRTAARALVAAQFCEQPLPRGMPCGNCPSCALVAAGRHPDVLWIDARGKFGVDDARRIAHHTALQADAGLSAFVVEACERLTGFAAAALLKTLEDPPGPALFLLLAEHPDRIEPTLRSRCQLLRLTPLATPQLADWLRAHWSEELSPARAAEIAAAAGGCLGKALFLLQGGGDTEAEAAASPPSDLPPVLQNALCATTLAQVLAAASQLAERRVPIEEVLAVLRDTFLWQIGALQAAGGPMGALPPRELAASASAWKRAGLAAACAACVEAVEAATHPVNALLNWERLLICLHAARGEC
jgi:hypothetical protein